MPKFKDGLVPVKHLDIRDCHIVAGSESRILIKETGKKIVISKCAIIPLELLPVGFLEHVDGAPMPNLLHDAAPDMLAALEVLHDETADYVRINHLGDPHYNRSMKMARAAIAKAKGLPNA